MTNRKLLQLVERIGNLLSASERREGAKSGLQPIHLRVLHYLSRCNRYSNTPAAVAGFLEITRGTASQSIIVLERAGYIRKRPDPEDGRVVRLQLTAKGSKILSIPTAWSTTVETLQAHAAAVTLDTLEELLRGLQRAEGSRSFGECKTCRHLQTEGREKYRCGLTGEDLLRDETLEICHEHAMVDPATATPE
jgi:MarR family transcriptional regulator, negative regulator of the multidrug operon emrRAB